MSEEIKSVRLSKVTKEFNISVGRITEFLASKGFEIVSNPNTRITTEMYALLEKEFKSDKILKEAAAELELEISKKKEPITLKEIPKPIEEHPEPEEQELIIKNLVIETPEPRKAPKPKAAEVTPEEKPEAPTAPTEAVEAATPALPETPVTPEEKSSPEPSTTSEPIPESPKDLKDQGETPPAEEPISSGPKVIGTIDLSAINNRTRPDKKSKKSTKASDHKKPAEGTPAKNNSHDPKAKTSPSKETQTAPKTSPEASLSETPKASPANISPEKSLSESPAPATTTETNSPESPTAPASNFLQTQYVTIEGPRMTGQVIDLSQFDKKKSPSSHSNKDRKGKRERIHKDPKSVDIAKATPQAGAANDRNHRRGDHKSPRKNERTKPAEINNNEIEKQIKETLARLGGPGKSQKSKHRREKRQMIAGHLQEEILRQEEERSVLKVTEFVTANELATMMNIPVTQIISTCMSIGQFVSINQRLTAEVISLLADEFGYQLEFVDADVMETFNSEEEIDNPEDLQSRPPVVAVMGHVDHGKTSLLDHIRKTNVIAGEAGGITQHIGAYRVKLSDGRLISFLDTPGHEAFTAMRARGAKVADIAIIVVAADDRVMPQTIEAINHAQAGNVPIVFAINKIDKPGANPDHIKQELASMNLLVEEWGGKFQSQDISAKQGLNMDSLMEKVLLEAELLDLKANPSKRAKGTVIESSLDKGRGYVAKILVQDGTVSIGDSILAGSTYGRVKAMYNERNQSQKSAGPSTPILLLGLNGAPQAGDLFAVTSSDAEAKDIATRRQQLQREQGLRTQKHITLDEIGRRIAIGDFKELNIIVKGDVDGSVEALSDSLLKLSTPEVQVNVIHKAVGQISEGDVVLASASEAIIIGFQVRPSVGARKLAETEQIDIRLYSIIYKAIEEIKDAIEGMLAPDIQEKITCNLEVREVFKITKVGTIAGCIVLDGKITRQTRVRIIREGIVVYEGKLGSLKRFKDDAKEVVSGQDCGLNIENFNDIKVSDIIEGFEIIETKRSL